MPSDSFQLMPETCPILEGIFDEMIEGIAHEFGHYPAEKSIEHARVRIVNEITLEFRKHLDDLVQENNYFEHQNKELLEQVNELNETIEQMEIQRETYEN